MADLVPGNDVRVNKALRCYVETEAQFRTAVEAGLASAARGPNRDIDTVMNEVRHKLLEW